MRINVASILVLLVALSLLFQGCSSQSAPSQSANAAGQTCVQDASALDACQKSLAAYKNADSAPSQATAPTKPSQSSNSDLYKYVLLPSDFTSTVYESGYQGKITPLVVSEIMYSRAATYGFTDSYTVTYTSHWNPAIVEYNLKFNEQVYEYPDEKTARAVFLDLNQSLFTGKFDKIDDVPQYFFTDDSSLRRLDIRRARADYVSGTYLVQKGTKILYIVIQHPVADFDSNYIVTVNQMAEQRLETKSTVTQDLGVKFKDDMSKNYIAEKSDDKFQVFVNNISYTPTENGSGLLKSFIVTIKNINEYPFYPVVSYYVQKPDLSKETTYEIVGQVYAKMTTYDYQLFDKGDQRSIFFVEPTSIRFDANQTALFKVQILDLSRGDSPYALSTFNFTVNMTKYMTAK